MSIADSLENVPPFMRHPAWRWNVALKLAATPELVGVPTRDPYLMEAVRFCRTRRDPVTNPTHFQKHHPEVYEAFLINMSSNPHGGFKWQIEAMLMTEASFTEIAQQYGFRGGAATIDMYAKLFFDIAQYSDKPLCILGNVLSSSLALDMGIDDYDYTWKAMAFNKGFDSLFKFLQFRAGARLPKDLKKWFDDCTQDRVSYSAYSTTGRLRNMFNEQARQVLDTAGRFYAIQNTILGKPGMNDGNTNVAAKQLLEAMQEVILNPALDSFILNNTAKVEHPVFTGMPPVPTGA